MVGMGLLLVIGVIVVVVFLGRRSHTSSPTPHSSASRPPAGASAGASAEVEAVLTRAVQAGLIDQAAATAILAAEQGREGAPVPARAVPPVVEAIGYVGSILVLVGMVAVVQRVWDELATVARLGIVGAAAVLLFAVGALVHGEADEVAWRLRSFVWLLSAGALAGFTAILTVDALGWSGEPVAVAIGATVAAYSAALWQLKDRPAQQLTAFVGMLVMLGGIAASLGGALAVGLTVLAGGIVWLALGHRSLLPPAMAAVLLGSIAVLVGAAITCTTSEWDRIGPIVGLVCAVGLVGFGTLVQRLVVTGVGVAGLFLFLPWTLAAVFGDALGAPLIFLASGVLLLVVMVVLLRRSSHGHGLGRGGLAPPAAV